MKGQKLTYVAKMADVGKNCQKVTKVAKNCQKIAKIAAKYQLKIGKYLLKGGQIAPTINAGHSPQRRCLKFHLHPLFRLQQHIVLSVSQIQSGNLQTFCCIKLAPIPPGSTSMSLSIVQIPV